MSLYNLYVSEADIWHVLILSTSVSLAFRGYCRGCLYDPTASAYVDNALFIVVEYELFDYS